MQTGAAWLALFFLGFLLVIAGFQGSLGRMVAVVFAPGILVDDPNRTNTNFQPLTAPASPTGTAV